MAKDNSANANADSGDSLLLLAPFCGKPACQFININPSRAKGVCADAYLQKKTLVVKEVELYPGHIACDGDTKSEIVCPLILKSKGEGNDLGTPFSIDYWKLLLYDSG